jgi:cytochrome b involved in lipid metabolism
MKKLLLVLGIVIALLFWWYKQWPDSTSESVGTPTSTEKTVTKTPFMYKVQKGEGLWQIAAKELGDGYKWMEIAQANNLQKPYVLRVGQELKIPGKETEVVSDTTPTFTLTQIAEHTTKDNCWMALEGKVYDVTPFVASGFHPGKAAILEGCGKDATELFNTRPMGTGTPHSERARKMLPKYLIGDLAQ